MKLHFQHITNRLFCTFTLVGVLLVGGCNNQVANSQNTSKQEATPLEPYSTNQASPHNAADPHTQLDAIAYTQLILRHWEEGRQTEAWSNLHKAQQRHPESAELASLQSQLLHASGQTSEALAALERAIVLSPSNPDFYVNRAQLYMSFERPKEALSDLNQAITLSPDHLAARFNRGAFHFGVQSYDAALSDFEHCIAVDPHMAAPYFNRAAVYDALGETEKAIADLEHFIELSDQPAWQETAKDLLTTWRNQSQRHG